MLVRSARADSGGRSVTAAWALPAPGQAAAPPLPVRSTRRCQDRSDWFYPGKESVLKTFSPFLSGRAAAVGATRAHGAAAGPGGGGRGDTPERELRLHFRGQTTLLPHTLTSPTIPPDHRRLEN